MTPSAEDVAGRNLQCPGCGAPLEIRSGLDEYQSPFGAAAFMPARSGGTSKSRIMPAMIVLLVIAVLIVIGATLVVTGVQNRMEQQVQSFQSTGGDTAGDLDLYGETISLAVSGDNTYTVSKTASDKQLVWDEEADSYYDRSTDCWVCYNTDVEPAVWQYWYEGISSDYGDYGWMEHYSDGWFIEDDYGEWVALPEKYDTDRLWYIEE